MADDKGKLDIKFTIDDSDLIKKIEEAKKGIAGMGDSAKKATTTIDTNVKKQTSLWGSLGNVVKGFGNTVRTVFASFGAIAGFTAFFALLLSGISSVIRFDKAMTNLSAIAGTTRKSIQPLEKDIRKIASESINTATAVADMAMELIKLGSTPDAVRALLKPVNDLSIGLQAGADKVAVLLKSTLNAFGESEREAQRYADVMAMAANKTALGFEEIAGSFTYISASAKAMGYTIEQTSAMIGTLVDSGIRAESAGRILSTMLGRLSKEGKTLEDELLKVKNSTDQMRTASKLFGAEGGRLALILANNTDKVKDLTREFENAGGSLDKLTRTQLESMSAKLNILTSAWEEFVLSMENGNGALANTFKWLLDQMTLVLVGMASMAKSANELRGERLEGVGQAEVDRIDEMTNNYIKRRKERTKFDKTVYTDEMEALDRKEKKEELIAWKQKENANRLLEIRQRLSVLDKNRSSENRDEILSLQKEKQDLETGYNALSKEREKSRKEVIAPDIKDVEVIEQTKERLAFLKQINNVERELNDEVLSGRELALIKIERKYSDLIAKAKELGLTDKKLLELQGRELATVTYKQDTDALKASLLEQENLYKEFETTKKEIGEEQAKEMYKNLIDVSKSYYDVLSDELDKINVKDMTAVEKDRYATLTKMMLDYTDNRDRAERAYMQKLINETQSTEQKILDIRKDFLDKKKKLEDQFSGEDLKNATKVLESGFNEQLKVLFDEFLSEKGYAFKLTTTIASATKEHLLIQINSLKNYLDTAKNLTKSQITSINNDIRKLESSLGVTTGGDSNKSQLALVDNEIDSLRRLKSELTKSIEELRNEFGDLANVEIAGIQSRLEVIDKQLDELATKRVSVLSDVFSDISAQISNMASSFSNMGASTKKFLNNISNAVGMASSISKSFSDIKKHNEALANGSGDFMSSLSAGMSVMSIYMTVANALQGIENNRIQSERKAFQMKQQMFLGEMQWQREMMQHEIDLARRRSISAEDSRQDLAKNIDLAKKMSEDYERIQQRLSDPNLDLLDQNNHLIQTQKDVIANAKKWREEYDRLVASGEENSKRAQQALRYALQGEGMIFEGKDWKEVQKMLNEGRVASQLKELAESFVNLGKSAEEAGLNIEDLKNSLRELMTGTTFLEMSDALADMFSKGSDAVVEFGLDFEKMLKNAVLSAFKNEYIVTEMKGLFDMMGDFGMDGDYTQEEIDKLRLEAKKVVEGLNKKWQDISGAIDLDFGEGLTPLSGSTDQIKRITESQATQIDASIRGMQLSTNLMRDEVIKMTQSVVQQNEYSKQTLLHLVEIKKSTDNLYEINSNIRTLANNNLNMINNANGI